MSYLDLSAEERRRFVELQVAGVRSAASIDEAQREYPNSPNAALAETFASLFTDGDRALLAKCWPKLGVP